MAALPPPTPHPPRLPKRLPPAEPLPLEDHSQVAQLAFSGVDFSSQAAAGLLFEQVHFRKVILLQTRLTGLRVFDSRFENSDLSGAQWEKARLRQVEFLRCRLSGAAWLEAALDDLLFRDCQAEGAVLASAALRRVRFEGCNLHGVSFEGATLTGVIFQACDLSQADFRGARMKDVDLRGSLLNEMQVGAKELQGATIDPLQAVQVVGLLGIQVKEIDP